MTRIEAIIKGCKLTAALFGLKKRQIRRALEAAVDSVEKQKEEASIAYKELFSQLAYDKADCAEIIRQMLQHKQTIISAKATIEALAEIEADLNAEAPMEDDDTEPQIVPIK